MHLTGWALFTLTAAVVLAVVAYLYSRRETPGKGRPLLAGVRWLTLSLLVLLLFNPDVPVPGLASGTDRIRVLLDGSLSMQLPAASGSAAESRWARASSQAREIAAGRDVVVFGAAPAVVPSESLADRTPDAGASRLAPALRTTSEAGARRVVVLTDGGIEDPAEVARLSTQLGMEIDVRPAADTTIANVAVADVRAPSWAESGEPIDLRVDLAAIGAADDTATVTVRRDGETLATARVAAPSAGRLTSATLRITPEVPDDASENGGLVRYDVGLDPDDAVPDDDQRSVYIHVSEQPSGAVIVSFRPTWEPRFLQPTLERSLGLPVHGYLQMSADRYLRLGKARGAGRSANAAAVRRAAARADLLVLHGLDASAPSWARDLAGTAERTLVFPTADAQGLDLPFSPPPATRGDWYPAPDIPASPVASILTTVAAGDLPPLYRASPADVPEGAWAPIRLRRDRRGATAPAVVAGDGEGRRWAVALAHGYWRWAFRGGEAQRAYDRLWGAVAGWLMEDDDGILAAAVRPAAHVSPRTHPVRWVAPGLNADSIAVAISTTDGEAVSDTTLAVVGGDTASAPSLPPGHYRYEARAFADGEVAAAGDGPLTVESYSPEFTRRTTDLPRSSGAEAESMDENRRMQPLHASPWPYLAIVLLLCAEWILRRRWGLR